MVKSDSLPLPIGSAWIPDTHSAWVSPFYEVASKVEYDVWRRGSNKTNKTTALDNTRQARKQEVVIVKLCK